jgi:hypothetical protein
MAFGGGANGGRRRWQGQGPAAAAAAVVLGLGLAFAGPGPLGAVGLGWVIRAIKELGLLKKHKIRFPRNE